jgi:hypothetical protein
MLRIMIYEFHDIFLFVGLKTGHSCLMFTHAVQSFKWRGSQFVMFTVSRVIPKGFPVSSSSVFKK